MCELNGNICAEYICHACHATYKSTELDTSKGLCKQCGRWQGSTTIVKIDSAQGQLTIERMFA